MNKSSNSTSNWLKAILITSPILLAAAFSVFLSVSNILNPEEIEPYEYVEYLNITAIELYHDFKTDPAAAELNYQDKYLLVTGVIAGWGFDEKLGHYIRLISDESGNQSVICSWYQAFFVQRMPEFLGEEITVSGKYEAWSEGNLQIINCSSSSVQVAVE